MLEFCFYFLVKSTFSSVLTVSLLFAFVAFWATAASSFTFLFPLQTMKQMMAAPKKRVSQKTDFVWFGLNISLYFVCFVSFVAPSAGGGFPSLGRYLSSSFFQLLDLSKILTIPLYFHTMMFSPFIFPYSKSVRNQFFTKNCEKKYLSRYLKRMRFCLMLRSASTMRLALRIASCHFIL